MSKRSERSHEPKPFDSRRSKRIRLVTPRNPAPAPPPTSAAKDDVDQSASS